MNFLMFKAVTHVYVYMYTYKYEYRCVWSKEIDVKICLSYLQLLIMNISFVSMTCISHWQICIS